MFRRFFAASAIIVLSVGVLPSEGFAQVNAQFRATLDPFVEQMRGNGCRTNGLSCRTNNPGAVTCASNGRGACTPVVRKFNGVPCGQPNDAACFERIEFGIATMANLIFQKIRKGCTSIYAILETCEYSASNAGNNSITYAAQIQRWTGIGVNEKMDVNNAIQMGKLITAMARYEAGKNGIGFNGEQLARGLAYVYGQETLPAGTPGFVPGTGPFVYPGDITRVPAYTSADGQISPFSGQVIGVSANQGAFSTPGASSGNDAYANPSLDQNKGLEMNPTPPSGGPSVATIVSQSSTAQPGRTISLSWSTLNMRVSPVCKLSVKYADGVEEIVAEANAGTKAVRIAPDAASGTATFSLSCTPLTGAVIEKKVIITIE
ncbi:MAG: hypothetical protein WAZ27_02215 [Minisyncoccia bacterium]